MANKVVKRVILLIAAVLILALCFGYYQLSRIGPIGTGYSAKIMCSSVFVSGREPDEIRNFDLLATKDYPIEINVNREEKSVTASIFGLFKQRAVYREGLGCTLAVDTSDNELEAQAAAAPKLPPPPPARLPWPRGQMVNLDRLPLVVDKQKLEGALDFAFTDPSPDKPIGTRAVVVVYRGRIIAERYAPGFYKDTPLLGWSMTKSVTNALVGILVRQGKLDVHKPAPVPEWKDPADPRSKITLDQLMRMSSGLKFIEEYEENITSDCNVMLLAKRDTAAFAASMPLETEPDAKWSYSSGTTNIISRIVRHAIGGTDADYFSFPRRELFNKLGMTSAVIEPDASGTFVGSSYMYATARDWARFGLLYLNGGVWQGQRILPEGWVKYSTTPTPKSDSGYGAQFWLNAVPAGSSGERWMPELPEDVYSARGHDGQYVTVMPSHNMVIVRLGFTPSHLKAWDHQKFILKILDAIK